MKRINLNLKIMKNYLPLFITMLLLLGISCQQKQIMEINYLAPKEIIDLGTVITEDLPYQTWGKEFMDAFGFEKGNHFDVRHWEFPSPEGGHVSGSNAYYTLFNHAGPHIDAPNHTGLGNGLDNYPIEKFVGPLKVFDVTSYPNGRTIPVEVFEGNVQPGDIVLTFTNYVPTFSEKTPPELITLSYEAATYLAELPVRAYATDAFSVMCNDPENLVESENVTNRTVPIHFAFLSRAIPIYEGLQNVDKLLRNENMLFVGPPLNIKDGDGMPIRPVALIYEAN